MYTKFSKGDWNPNLFIQVTSLLTPCYEQFRQEENCIVNDDRQLEKGTKEYHYISMVTKETYSGSVTIRTTCDFVEFGAPLLVLTDDLVQDSKGWTAYGHHFEIVGYENGINIWELNGGNLPCKVAFEEFAVPYNTPFTLEATIHPDKDEIVVRMQGKTFTKHIENLPKTFHVGITACEGINHFYDFGVDV